MAADREPTGVIKALVFDVFGTLFDWRTSLIDSFGLGVAPEELSRRVRTAHGFLGADDRIDVAARDLLDLAERSLV